MKRLTIGGTMNFLRSVSSNILDIFNTHENNTGLLPEPCSNTCVNAGNIRYLHRSRGNESIFASKFFKKFAFSLSDLIAISSKNVTVLTKG